jgi:hypothetical protein
MWAIVKLVFGFDGECGTVEFVTWICCRTVILSIYHISYSHILMPIVIDIPTCLFMSDLDVSCFHGTTAQSRNDYLYFSLTLAEIYNFAQLQMLS